MELSKFFEDNVTVIIDRIQDRITNKLPLSLPSSPIRHTVTPLTPVREVRVKAVSPHRKPISFQVHQTQNKKKEAVKDEFRQRSWTTDSETSWTSRDSSSTSTPDVSPTPSPMSREYHHDFPSPTSSPAPYRKRSATMSSLGSTYSSGLHPNRRRDVNHNKTTSPVKAVLMLTASSPHRSDSTTSSTASSPVEDITLLSTSRRPSSSWRKAIFNRVCTPQHSVESGDEGSQSHGKLHSATEIRAMWKKAILESLLLIKMEKENLHMRKRQEEGGVTLSRKLEYQELTPCLKEITCVWEKMLAAHDDDDVRKALIEEETRVVPKLRLLECVKKGVPRVLRGQIWLFLMQQQQMMNAVSSSMCDGASYQDLLRQLTTHQHAILIDLGRTFPNHPYFSKSLGSGQLELFNLLKAYSLLDTEVGYCQGLSFIVGLLLMHMEEISAFHLLKYLMYDLGLRKQFRPNMMALQVKLYQLTRLLHDHYKDVYDHFEAHEISPTLYAAPWFLTMFASQFPLGFVARVFDMIFIQGIDALFKVALMLIGSHRALILQCDSFESVVDFLKITLPEMVQVQMERIINQAFELDLDKDLQAYEVEYQVLSEEMTYSSPSNHHHHSPQHQRRRDQLERHSPLVERRRSSIDLEMLYCLENQNRALKNQNTELLEKLQHAQSQRRSFELTVLTQQVQMDKLKSHIRALELERAALLMSAARLRKLVPRETLHNLNLSLPSTPSSSSGVLPVALSSSHDVLPATYSSSSGVLPAALSSSPDFPPATSSSSSKEATPQISGASFSSVHMNKAINLKLNKNMNHFHEADTPPLNVSMKSSKNFGPKHSFATDHSETPKSSFTGNHSRAPKSSVKSDHPTVPESSYTVNHAGAPKLSFTTNHSATSCQDSARTTPLILDAVFPRDCQRPEQALPDHSPPLVTSSKSTFTSSVPLTSMDDIIGSNIRHQKVIISSTSACNIRADSLLSSSSGARQAFASRSTSDIHQAVDTADIHEDRREDSKVRVQRLLNTANRNHEPFSDL